MKQYLISIIALALIIVHLFFPEVKIDNITLVLLVLGFLPFFFPYLKSLELPGGFKITLKDAKKVFAKITPGDISNPNVHAEVAQAVSSLDYLREIAATDPNLALVGFRIEIEKLIRKMAAEYKLGSKDSLKQAIKELEEKGRIAPGPASGLMDLVALANQAAHGVKVSPGAINWVLDYAPELFNTLLSK